MIYVHVGKTGGTTLDQVLRSNCEMYELYGLRSTVRACLNALVQESYLSELTTYTLHTKGAREIPARMRTNNITTFLWTIRNPVARAISAFYMEHPNNTRTRHVAAARNRRRREYRTRIRSDFYDRCFPTAEDLALVLARKKSKTIVTVAGGENYHSNETKGVNCFDLGGDALRGRGVELLNTHFFHNYKRYAAQTVDEYSNKEVLVIRTELLWDDTKRLNTLLLESDMNRPRNEHALAEGRNHTYGSERNPVKSGLSDEGKLSFCCFLSDELQIFQDLTWRATNLNQAEKRRYLDNVYDDCNVKKEERVMTFSWSNWRGSSCDVN